MLPRDFDDCFRALGLPPRSTLAAVRARYRRLLFLHHPDRRGDDPFAQREFARVTQAYQSLSEAFARHGHSHPFGRCDTCGDFADLFRGPDGNAHCLNCATMRTGRRGLPSPPIAVVSGAGAAFLLVVSIILLAHGLWTYSAGTTMAAMIVAASAIVWLMVLCLVIRYTVSRAERQRMAQR